MWQLSKLSRKQFFLIRTESQKDQRRLSSEKSGYDWNYLYCMARKYRIFMVTGQNVLYFTKKKERQIEIQGKQNCTLNLEFNYELK